MFRPRLTTQYPDEKRPKPERFHGRHVLNRYEDGMEKCIGCELCAGVCPARCVYARGADNPPDAPVSPGRALRVRLRDQLPAVHPLRPVRGGLPDRGDHRDQAVRVLVHQPRGRDLHEVRAAGRRRRARPPHAVGAVDGRRGRPHQRLDARDGAERRRRLRGPGRVERRARLRRAAAGGRPAPAATAAAEARRAGGRRRRPDGVLPLLPLRRASRSSARSGRARAATRCTRRCRSSPC